MKKIPIEELKADALKYNSRGEWFKKSTNKYHAARNRGLLDECCKHMVRQLNPYRDDIGIIYAFFFNDNSVYIGLTVNPVDRFRTNTTKKGTVFKKIQKGYAYEYKVLEEKIPNKILADREIFYIEHYKTDPNFTVINIQGGGGRGRLNQIKNEQIFASALKYNTKIEWYNSETSFYRLAKKRGIMSISTAHMQKGNTRWTTEMLIADAKKYKSKVEWENYSASAYNTARCRKLLTVCCEHMDVIWQKWTDEDLCEEALKYTTVSEWLKKSRKSYSVAHKRGILEKCCAHMKRLQRTWTYESIWDDCMIYSTKKEWRENSPRSYEAAYKKGILEECVKMILAKNKIEDATIID